MTKILITGANSYIGTAFENYISSKEGYQIDTVDTLDGSWREKDFSAYDVVFHVAGLAHADVGKITEAQKALYYAVNTDLAVEAAKKAKAEGVGQFIFMSSAIIYGESAPIGKQKLITRETPPSPANCYGDSKLQAEKGIMPLQSEGFKVVILRPPTIYGKNSKGNYPTLSKFARKLHVFPKVENQRSMLYVENLCAFVYFMIKNGEKGIFFPQNQEYVNTSALVKVIATAHGRKMKLVRGFGWALKVLGLFSGLVNKAFGSLAYDLSISEYKEDYRVCELTESIRRTEV